MKCAPTQPAASLSQPSTSGQLHFEKTPPSRFVQVRRGRSSKRRILRVLSRAVAEGQLIRWLDLPADKLSVKNDPLSGLVTSRAIGKGQTILTVPASQWITTEAVEKSAVGPYVKGLQPWLQVAVFLLYERANSSSIWGAYINFLPETVDTPLMWSDAELEVLSGTQLFDTISGYRDYFAAKFRELDATVFSPNRDTFDATVFSEEHFVWAAIAIRARVHPPLEGDNLALVPLADMVAHQRGVGAAWKVTSGGFGRGGKALNVEAQRNYDAGETVTMDYGPDKLDSDLLLNYGVMDEFLTKGGFMLNLELPEGDRFFDDKADILEINGLSESQEFLLTTGNEPEEALLAYLRLINLSGPDAFLLESLFRNEAWGHLLKPVSLENETAVFSSMIEGCKEALSGYGSPANDKENLRAADAGSRKEKAIRIKIGEREALESTLLFFEERVGRLEKIEYYQERRLKGLGLLDEDGRTTFDSFFKDGIA